MSVNSTGNVNVKCPYYISESDRYMTCEGVNGDVIKQRFGGRKAIGKYQKINCNKYPNDCLIAGMLDEKYNK